MAKKRGRPKTKMIIYKIRNRLNGKVYIGQTTRSLNKRMREHLQGRQKVGIDGAIKKYGIDNFGIEVIDKTRDIDELNKLEIKWIEMYDCLSPNGYNLHTGGNNHQCSEITKKRIGIASTGRIKTIAERAKLSKALSGRIFSEEHKENIRKKAKARIYPLETRRKMSESGKGKIFTEEHKKNISKAKKGQKHSVEHVANLPQNQKGFHDGDKHPRALLKNKQVLKIKEMISGGISNKSISEVFGITQGHVSMIKTGRAYKYVEELQ